MSAAEAVQRKPYHELSADIQRGGRFVSYQYVISILILTFRRTSQVYYIPPGESRVQPGLVYSLLSAVLGWWGIPWGFIYTPVALVKNFSGGIDVTADVMAALQETAVTTLLQYDQVLSKRTAQIDGRPAWLVTFQLADGAVWELEVTSEWYGYLTPGDIGRLSVQESRFWEFHKEH